MRKWLGILTAGAIGLAASLTVASAADMAVKAPLLPPAPLPTWTGWYIGGDGGDGWARQDLLGDHGDDPCCVNPRGGFGGVLLGYNLQMNQWLLGIETDMQGADISQTVNDLNFGDTLRSKVSWFGSTRGRLGLIVGNALVYGTGGVAYGGVNNSVSGPALTGTPYNIERTAVGYAAGGGVEVKFGPHWTARVEYQFVDLGKNVPSNPSGAPYTQFAPLTFVNDNEFHTVRFGVSYLIGGP